jgi:transposase
MRQLRELFTLHFEQGLTQRQLARSLGVVRSTIERTLRRFTEAKLSWPLVPDLTDAQLEQLLYRSRAHQGTAKSVLRPNYAAAVIELARKGVTRQLLWREYKVLQPDGIGYSVYCDELAGYQSCQDLAYRNDHQPGVRGYFDFAGMKLAYLLDGVRCDAHIFVATLGYSAAIFAHAYTDEKAHSWLDGQARAFARFGGVPQILVPDNPKALVTRACSAEPQLTSIYRDFAVHFGATVVPARVRKPKDKASVEGGVRIVTMRMAAVRDRVFESLEAVNIWLAKELSDINSTPFQKRVGSRNSVLTEEILHLKALPLTDFYAPRYLIRKVARDYHVEIDKRYYCVPYQHVGKAVEIRITGATGARIEVLLGNARIALYSQLNSGSRHITTTAHMPIHHQRYRDPKLPQRAEAIGPHTATVIDLLFQKRRHPELAIRAASGVLGLNREHSKAALESACERAIELNAVSYRNIALLLKAQREEHTLIPQQIHQAITPETHEYVRGADYYDAHEIVRNIAIILNPAVGRTRVCIFLACQRGERRRHAHCLQRRNNEAGATKKCAILSVACSPPG